MAGYILEDADDWQPASEDVQKGPFDGVWFDLVDKDRHVTRAQTQGPAPRAKTHLPADEAQRKTMEVFLEKEQCGGKKG